jgi:hypothetical protein
MRNRSSSRSQAAGSLIAIVGAACVLACGVADRVDVENTGDLGGETRITSGVNVCPHFEGSLILPERIAPSESAFIAVRATDPDAADSLLVFAWTALSGTFSASDEPVTNYSCSKLGTEQLTVTAKDDQGCSSDLTLPVECIAH